MCDQRELTEVRVAQPQRRLRDLRVGHVPHLRMKLAQPVQDLRNAIAMTGEQIFGLVL